MGSVLINLGRLRDMNLKGFDKRADKVGIFSDVLFSSQYSMGCTYTQYFSKTARKKNEFERFRQKLQIGLFKVLFVMFIHSEEKHYYYYFKAIIFFSNRKSYDF